MKGMVRNISQLHYLIFGLSARELWTENEYVVWRFSKGTHLFEVKQIVLLKSKGSSVVHCNVLIKEVYNIATTHPKTSRNWRHRHWFGIIITRRVGGRGVPFLLICNIIPTYLGEIKNWNSKTKMQPKIIHLK